MESTLGREVSLINLFWKLLFGWRRLMVMGIVFAVLVSGIKYVKGQFSYQAALKQQDNNEQEIILTQEEQAAVEDVLVLQRRVNAVRSYLQDSIWMNLDAYNENVLVLRYYVDSDYTFNYTDENTIDYTKDVVAAYCGYVSSGKVAAAVAEKLDMSDKINYFAELITVTDGEMEERNQNVFEILVAYTDAESLEQIRTVVTENVEEQTNRISNEIGSHTLKITTENITTRVDKDLITAQRERNDILNLYRVQLSTLKDALNETQLAALDREQKENELLEEVDKVILVRPFFSVKYAVLGFIVGVFLACVWLMLEVLLSGKIQEAKEVSNLYGMRVLGEIYITERRKRMFHMVDALLMKWKNHNKKQMSREQRIHITSSNIEIACKKEGINQLYVTGSEIEKQCDDSLEEIWKNLSVSGIQVYKGENIVYDARSLKEMAEIGNVILVEQIGISLYSEIEKEIKTVEENGIKVIGSVVVC